MRRCPDCGKKLPPPGSGRSGRPRQRCQPCAWSHKAAYSRARYARIKAEAAETNSEQREAAE